MQHFIFIVILANRIDFAHNALGNGSQPHNGTLADIQKQFEYIKRTFPANAMDVVIDVE